MNVLLCGDNGMYVGMELVVYTLMHHNKNVNLYIFTMDIDVMHPNGEAVQYKSLGEWQRQKLKTIVKMHDRNSNICFIDVHDYYLKYFNDGPNHYSHFSPYAPMRLLADVILPSVDGLLYLDCDVAITGDITPVYNDYLNRDTCYSAYFTPGAFNGEGEMVSGVMIMNLAKIRKEKFLEKARNNYMTHQYMYPDQDALRDAGTALRLPPNVGYCESLEDSVELPLIIHFTNMVNPKIYMGGITREKFFRKFPFLKYVKDGVEQIDKINFH